MLKRDTRQEHQDIIIKDSGHLKETKLLMFITKLTTMDLLDTKQ